MARESGAERTFRLPKYGAGRVPVPDPPGMAWLIGCKSWAPLPSGG